MISCVCSFDHHQCSKTSLVSSYSDFHFCLDASEPSNFTVGPIKDLAVSVGNKADFFFQDYLKISSASAESYHHHHHAGGVVTVHAHFGNEGDWSKAKRSMVALVHGKMRVEGNVSVIPRYRTAVPEQLVLSFEISDIPIRRFLGGPSLVESLGGFQRAFVLAIICLFSCVLVRLVVPYIIWVVVRICRCVALHQRRRSRMPKRNPGQTPTLAERYGAGDPFAETGFASESSSRITTMRDKQSVQQPKFDKGKSFEGEIGVGSEGEV